MKFNRSMFLGETCGGLDAALDCIDDLLEIINEYIKDDIDNSMSGYGCYGKQAHSYIVHKLNKKPVGEYIDIEVAQNSESRGSDE